MTQPLSPDDQRHETELVAHCAPEDMARELVAARKRIAELEGVQAQQQAPEEPAPVDEPVPAEEPAEGTRGLSGFSKKRGKHTDE